MKLKIEKGRATRPQRVVIYAPEGIGKTTLGSEFEKPLILDLEAGSYHIDASRVTIESYSDFESAVRELMATPPKQSGFQTIVIDTIDWLESLVVDAVCSEKEVKGIEDFGYGKGYVYVGERFAVVLGLLDCLVKTGYHVVVLAHSEIKKFEQPDAQGAYDRYTLKLSKRVEPMVKEWADMLLFGNWRTRLAEKGGGDDKNKRFRAVGGKERILYCTHSAAHDAKNRHGLKDEEPWTIETIRKAFENVGCGKIAETPTAPTAVQPADVGRDAIPGLAPENGGPEKSDPELEAAFAGIEQHVTAFLVKRGIVKPGDTFLSVPATYRQRILGNLDKFKQTVLSETAQAAAAGKEAA